MTSLTDRPIIRKVLNIATAFGVTLLWVLFVSFIFHVINTGSIWPSDTIRMGRMAGHPDLSYIFKACVIAPVLEELLFRFAPLALIKDSSDQVKLSVIIITSALFGLAHGSISNILTQGVFGVTLSYLYLREGYWSCVILHSLWNFLIILELFVFMK